MLLLSVYPFSHFLSRTGRNLIRENFTILQVRILNSSIPEGLSAVMNSTAPRYLILKKSRQLWKDLFLLLSAWDWKFVFRVAMLPFILILVYGWMLPAARFGPAQKNS